LSSKNSFIISIFPGNKKRIRPGVRKEFEKLKSYSSIILSSVHEKQSVCHLLLAIFTGIFKIHLPFSSSNCQLYGQRRQRSWQWIRLADE